MIEQLRKREALLFRWRWLLIGFSSFLVIAWLGLLIYVLDVEFPDETAKLILLVHFLPVCFISLVFWSAYVGYLISRWRGDTKTRILLKIADELQKRDVCS